MTCTILIGDCRKTLRNLPDASVDSVVCDPPYHLTSIVKRFGSPDAAPCKAGATGVYQRSSTGFMGQTWDGGDVAFQPETWAEVLRVLKPGGHLLAFSGTRTYHRLACAVEDAGFEIRDMISWLYGSGFPKSHDVSKGIDRIAGVEREVVGQHSNGFRAEGSGIEGWQREAHSTPGAITAPATAEAQQWEGWGTALKPACEPICLARKPLIGTVAANVLAHGTGALNIDGCRIEAVDKTPAPVGEFARPSIGTTGHSGIRDGSADNLGRWPANLCHDGSEEVLAGFPETESGTGAVKRSTAAGHRGNALGAESRPAGTAMVEYGDSGSAARFFYCAKATTEERGEGNNHPTVKPVALMEWLVTLVTPKGGTVLDPFMGSGSTGLACQRKQFSFIGCELSADYAAIAERRLRDDAGMFASIEVVPPSAPKEAAA